MNIIKEQYERIALRFLRRRGNVKTGNFIFISAIIRMAENGCKWRALLGNWNPVRKLFDICAENGVFKRVYAVLIASVVFCAPSFAAGISRDSVLSEFQRERPKSWGVNIGGVASGLGGGKIIALTFDACGGSPGDYDRALIDFLAENGVPATLFISSRWIDAHTEDFAALAANPLFEIACHGARHKPLSVSGKNAYGIEGTKNAGEVFDEVWDNAVKIEKMTGTAPRFFRSGTAHYDDVAVRILGAMGFVPVGFTINGDAGGTLKSSAVAKLLSGARESSIVLMHMNRPKSGALRGLREALPALREKGFIFVQLSDIL